MVKLVGFLLLVGVVLVYWKWIVCALLLVWLWRMAPKWWAAHQVAQEARREAAAGLVARAEQQNRWALAGDPRGTFGDYTPAI